VQRLVGRGLIVLAVSRTAETLVELAETIPGVVPCIADLRTDEAAKSIAKHIDGTVQAAVHVAGVPLGGSIDDVTTDAILAAVDLKVNGMLRLVRAVDSSLERGSRLIAVTGNLGYDPIPEAVTAGVANAALANLVRQLNRTYAPRGVTCHAVAPGPVDTARLRVLVTEMARVQHLTEEETLDRLRSAAPTGELATPDQIAWAVNLLLDNEATALAGSTLLLDMGRRIAIP
jgi:NAD(P)-dependent dehydrogenase (short-subunit alcohol dehydrogenase family)